MPILRAGPWGNLTDPHQSEPSGSSFVPSDNLPVLDYYPVNVGKTNWPGKVWSSYYYAPTNVCPGPDTVRATSLFFGTQRLARELTGVTVVAECTYYWVSPFGAMYGELEVWWGGEYWLYTQSISSAPIITAQGGTNPDDPTGEYNDYSGTYTVTTP